MPIEKEPLGPDGWPVSKKQASRTPEQEQAFWAEARVHAQKVQRQAALLMQEIDDILRRGRL